MYLSIDSSKCNNLIEYITENSNIHVFNYPSPPVNAEIKCTYNSIIDKPIQILGEEFQKTQNMICI